MYSKLSKMIAVFGVVLLFAPLSIPALAHERRDVGPYQFVVGWMVEPAFEGEKNGVDLHVSGGGQMIEGLAETLQVEVTYNPTGVSQTMPLRALFGQPGRYTADLVPTRPGAYAFRFFGIIEETEIDETFVPYSMGGGFNDVGVAADIHFPERLPAVRELEAAVRGAQATATQAQEAALVAGNSRSSNSIMLALIALLFGAVGAGTGATALAMVARKR